MAYYGTAQFIHLGILIMMMSYLGQHESEIAVSPSKYRMLLRNTEVYLFAQFFRDSLILAYLVFWDNGIEYTAKHRLTTFYIDTFIILLFCGATEAVLGMEADLVVN
mmetsp:Transcript_31523/g.41744  ORF Transcript_31523/g.41744 Transcript_31523/m.41744 type:complete len:107 (+) Transcript_31523:264-584(+)